VRCSSSEISTSAPPRRSVQKRPATELSKESGESRRKRSTGSGKVAIRAAFESARHRWVIITPFGRPVDPEV
jgi:hypothetical protein